MSAITIVSPRTAALGEERYVYLGAILLDESSGSLVALTASQLDPKRSDVNSQLNEIVDNNHSDTAKSKNAYPVRECSELLVCIPLESDLPFSDDLNVSNGEVINDIIGSIDVSWKYVNNIVVIWSKDSPIRVTLKSTHGIFKMMSPYSNELESYALALEMVSSSKTELDFGDLVGALITSTAGAMIGVVVCGDLSVGFAAPIFDAVKRRNLKVCNRAFREKYNNVLIHWADSVDLSDTKSISERKLEELRLTITDREYIDNRNSLIGIEDA